MGGLEDGIGHLIGQNPLKCEGCETWQYPGQYRKTDWPYNTKGPKLHCKMEAEALFLGSIKHELVLFFQQLRIAV